MKGYRLSVWAALLAGALVTIGAIAWFSLTGYPWNRAVFLVCPGLAFTAMLVLGSHGMLERMQRWVQAKPRRVCVLPAALWFLFVVYAGGMGIATVNSAITMAVYLSGPFVLLRVWPRAEPIAILWIWLPLEFGIIRELLTMRVPGGDVHYAFAQFLAIDAGIVAFLVCNKTPHVGYRFEWDKDTVRGGVLNFIWFAAIAIPVGLAIHFIRYSFTPGKLIIAVPAFAGIFFLTALPEEFLFRGLIQNWIGRVLRKPGLSLLISAVIFGASHLNNDRPLPNYRYFLMATIAGIFYGRAWGSTGSLMASSLTHALVDTCWTVLFR